MYKISQRAKTVTVAKGVTVDIKPMSIADYARAFGLLGGYPQLTSGKELDLAETAQLGRPVLQDKALLELVVELVPRYASNLRGVELEQEDGTRREATVDELLAVGGAVLPLVTVLILLITNSTLTEQEQGN